MVVSRSHQAGAAIKTRPATRARILIMTSSASYTAYRHCLRLILVQPLEPPPRRTAHILRRGAAKAGAALHRIAHCQDLEHVLGDARLDRLHGFKWQPVQRHIVLGSRRDDP